MRPSHTDIPFEEWIRRIFDHPVAEPAWHWSADYEHVGLQPRQTVAYTTRLFEHAGVLLAPYTDGQANQGLYFLISPGSSPLWALNDVEVPVSEKVCCIRAITRVFESCFAARCTPHLSHINESGGGSLNVVCHMWWDIFVVHGEPTNPAHREIDAACLSVMESTLELPSVACQESALHGLGHWILDYPDRCRNIVARFLQRHPELRPELLEYAERARVGDVM